MMIEEKSGGATATMLTCIGLRESLEGCSWDRAGAVAPRLVVVGELAAVALDVPLAEFVGEEAESKLKDLSWLGPRVTRHDALTRGAFAAGPVVPCRFGTLFADDAALGDRDLLGGEFDAEIAAGDHHRIRMLDDAFEIIEGCGLLDLGNDRNAGAEGFARHHDIGGALDEGEGDVVDAVLQRKEAVGDVLLCERRNRNRAPGGGDAFAAQDAAGGDGASDAIIAIDPDDVEHHLAVVDQELVAQLQRGDEFRVGDGDDVGIVRRGGGAKPEFGRHADIGLPTGNVADAEFRSLQVGEQRDGAADGFFGFTCGGDAGGVAGVVAVREIEAEEIDAGAEEFLHLERAIAGGTERGEDLGAATDCEHGRAPAIRGQPRSE
jgi:hypothetical protein